MTRPTVSEVNLSNIESNIQGLHSIIAEGAKLMAVVKADAYGHGIIPVSRKALASGAHWLGVAIPEEGQLLREEGIKAPILVLGPVSPEAAEDVIRYNLRPAVFRQDTIEALEKLGRKTNRKVYIHLKIDTGMNRIGIRGDRELRYILGLIRDCSYVVLEGMFTHFAISDAADKGFTIEQNRKFKAAVKYARSLGMEIPILHAANSAAIIDCPDTHYNMVRAGISIYGYYPSEEVAHDVFLKPALTWKTRIVHIKIVHSGETISYGRTYKVKEQMKIATLPVGYGDGYRRDLGNRGSVLVRGERAPIIGRICMDQCMIDVSHIPNVGVGDEVVLLGQQGEQWIHAEEMAKWCHTISYEILTTIGKRVPRVYVEADDIFSEH